MEEMELETDITLSVRVAIRLRMSEDGPEVTGVELKHCEPITPAVTELMQMALAKLEWEH